MTLVNRWYDLLRLFTTHGRLSLDELKASLNSSPQTIKKNIELLNEQLAGLAEIHKEGSEYVLKITNYCGFDKIMSGRLKRETDFNSGSKRIAFILKELIQSQDYIITDDLSEKLGVSRGTISKDLRQVKDLIRDFNVELIGTPNKGIKIEGSEFSLRMLLLHYVFDYFTESKIPEAIRQKMNVIAQDVQLEKRYLGIWEKVILITMQRIKDGHFLEEAIQYYHNTQMENEAVFELQFLLETDYEMTISRYESDFMVFPLSLGNTAVKDADLEDARKLFRLMMNKIHELVHIEIDQEQLFKELKYHFLFTINRLIFHIEVTDIFGLEIKNKYPLAYELAEIGLKEVARILGTSFSTGEVSYLSVYFQLMLKNEQAKPEKKVAVVCNTGRGTALMIKKQLENVLGPEVAIFHFSEADYQKENLASYFAVFTTIPLENHPQVPVIRLSDLFNDDWLLSEWQKVQKEKYVAFKTIDFAFYHLEGQSYQEGLNGMLSDLKKIGKIDEEFVETILAREAGESAIIDNGVSFPHGINSSGETITFAIGSGVTGEVDLIFLAAIPEKMDYRMEDELITLYDTIFKIASQPLLRDKVKGIDTKQEYLQLIIQEGVI